MSKPLKRCREVVARDREVLSQARRIAYYPFVVSRAEGSRIWDLDENEYIDLLSGAALNNVGHCRAQALGF